MNTSARPAAMLLLGLVLLALGLAGQALPGRHRETPLRAFYASTGGDIVFPHDRHAQMEMPCSACHHELLTEERDATCLICHHPESFSMVEWPAEGQGELHTELAAGGDDAACQGCHEHGALMLPVAPAARTKCSTCHAAELPAIQAGHRCDACHAAGSEYAWAACRNCHGSGEGEPPTCATCHGDAGYSADMLAHAELTAIEGHTCTGCHVPARLGTAMHDTCNRCHLDLERTTYVTRSPEDNASVCKTCHL